MLFRSTHQPKPGRAALVDLVVEHLAHESMLLDRFVPNWAVGRVVDDDPRVTLAIVRPDGRILIFLPAADFAHVLGRVNELVLDPKSVARPGWADRIHGTHCTPTL